MLLDGLVAIIMVMLAFGCLQFPSWTFLYVTGECYGVLVSLSALVLVLGGEASALS